MVGAISESMFHKGFRLTHRPLPTYPTENAVPASGLERHGTVRTAWQMDSGQIPRICLVRSKGDAPGVSRATVATAEVRLVGSDTDAGVAQPPLRAFGEWSSLVQIFQRNLQRMRRIQVPSAGLSVLNRFVDLTEHSPHLLLGMGHEGTKGCQQKTAQKCSDGQRQQTPYYKKGPVLE